MRRGRPPGRPPGSGNRPKTCIVRMDADDHKKLTGPLKKRPILIKKTPRQRKQEIYEDLSDYNLVTARTKRTPKPNPKYSNENILSMGYKKKSDEEDESDDFLDEFVGSSDEQELEEEDDETSEEEKLRKRTISRVQTTVKRGPGRPPRKEMTENEEMREFIRKRKANWQESITDTITARNKRLNIELYGGSDSDGGQMSPFSRRGRPTKNVSNYGRQQSSKTYQAHSESDDDFHKEHSDEEIEMTPGGAATLDDFETMPTFTIVNVNDIINKKGDVLLQKSPNDDDSNASSQNARNRRKTMHTTILSDKIDKSKITPPPRTPFPPRKPVSSFSSLSQSRSGGESGTFKAAPRILNSVIAKKSKLIAPAVAARNRIPEATKYDSVERKAKENLHMNTYGQSSSTQKKLPNEKVLVQRQGNKIIKKITCFETWYVINIPNTDPPVNKNSFEMSLVGLGNRSHEIVLPSSAWSLKITLQKMTENQINKGDYEEFTGEVQDPKIDESEKHLYQPVNIMCRRSSLNQKQRMPFDRAVIFKNKTFFINIDGKNVKLIGAPQSINSISEINTLLEIVEHIGISNQFVEQTTFAL